MLNLANYIPQSLIAVKTDDRSVRTPSSEILSLDVDGQHGLNYTIYIDFM